MNAVKTRVWSYDLLSRCRGELMGLSILWVTLYHAYSLTIPLPGFQSFRSYGYLGVDVFILLSAMGLSMSLSRREQRPGEFYVRRLLRVMPAYWLVVGCYGLALRAAGRTTLTTLAWTMSTLFFWAGQPGCFNWYIPALLGFYLITPACYAFLKRFPLRRLFIAVAFCVSFVLYYKVAVAGRVDLCNFIYRIPVFLMGLLVGLYISEKRTLTIPRLCLWASGLVAAPVLSCALRRVGHWLSPCFGFGLFCVFLCLGLSRLMLFLPEGGPRKFLRLLGSCSLEIYLLNAIFEREYPLLSQYLSFGPWQIFYYAVTIPLNIALGVGLHRLLEKPLKYLGQRLA